MTTTTLPADFPQAIVSLSKTAVKSFVFKKYPKFFSDDEIGDIASDVILKAYVSFHRYDSRWALSTWIGTIAANCVKDAVDYKVKRRSISGAMARQNRDGEEMDLTIFGSYRGDEYDADRDLIAEEFRSSVAEVRSSLKEKDRPFFDMLSDSYKPREMAKEFGCTSGAASVRSHKIRRQTYPALFAIAKEYGITCRKF